MRIGSTIMMISGISNVAQAFGDVADYAQGVSEIYDPSALIIAAVDRFVLAVVLLVFGLGVYELFIAVLDIRLLRTPAQIRDEQNYIRLLGNIGGLDDLKKKLGKVIIMSLLVKTLGFFENAKV